MNVTLWNEIDDQQAEKARGGKGIGQELSFEIKDAFAVVRSLGYDNFTQFNNAEGFFPGLNVGQIISNRVQELKAS